MGLVSKIKAEAANKKVKIQNEDCTKFDVLLNQAFFLEKDIEEETRFLKMVMTRGAETQERVGLHASNMLVSDDKFCLRSQVLSLIYRQLQGEQISAGLKRIFEEGNAIHEKWQRIFIRAGWSCAEDLDYTRYSEEFKMSYTPDIVCRIKEIYDGSMVGEIKSVNTFQFTKMQRHPSAWKQCQWYMHLEKIKKGFVLSEDKNTQEFKIELYDYDYELVKPYEERAKRIIYFYYAAINNGRMVKRPDDATAPTCKRCKTCVMRDACWNINNGRVRITGKG